MWVRDPDGEEGSECGRKYGLATVMKMVDEVEFPLEVAASADRVVADANRIDHATVVPAEEIPAHVDVDTAADPTGVHGALGRALRQGGDWTYHAGSRSP